MQFIPLDNFKAILRRACSTTSPPYVSFVDTTGESRTLWYANTALGNLIPFLNTEGTLSSIDTVHLYAYASTDSIIPSNKYAITETVGNSICETTSVFDNGNANARKGWSMNITITGSETKTINSIYFARALKTGSSSQYPSLIFAVKLDTPVELNAENNYTANFTFAIEF